MKKLPTLFFILLFAGLLNCLPAQNESSKWCFGMHAGLDFMTNPPTAISNCAITMVEGSSSIADSSGNLLFYTDGIVVYNSANTIMANGTGLTGYQSCAQSALIVKKPGNNTLYYIFSQGADALGLNYSVVDMSLATGMGSVTIKNVLLSDSSSEKLTAVKHANGTDIWVLTHDNTGNIFRAFLVSAAGINTVAVLSSVGSIYVDMDYMACLKASPDGTKLATAIGGTGFEIYDFNSSTGAITNPIYIGPNFPYAYGVEFSADGTKLYGTNIHDASYMIPRLYQWDLSAGSATAIIASQYTVSNTGATKCQLQLASNGNIYVARLGEQMLGVIKNPCAPGAACNYVEEGQSIAPNECAYGLPNIITSGFEKIVPFACEMNCYNASFFSPLSSNPTSTCPSGSLLYSAYSWNFGDTASGTANTSALANPTHIFSFAGNYKIKLIATFACCSDTFLRIVSTLPKVNVNGRTPICRGEHIWLTASNASFYNWSSTIYHTAQAYVSPSVTTTYSVTGIDDKGCSLTKTITVTVEECTGIEELSNTLAFSIHPNPFSNELHIELQQPAQAMISNMNGSILLSTSLEGGKNTIDTSALPAGIYIMKLSSAQGFAVSRVVKTD